MLAVQAPGPRPSRQPGLAQPLNPKRRLQQVLDSIPALLVLGVVPAACGEKATALGQLTAGLRGGKGGTMQD